jgi:CRISPR-associated protein (TIGR03986 family)
VPFYNPYGFVPTPERTGPENSFAQDHDPTVPGSRENHSRYWEDRYTGNIPVVLTTRTPLFITNPESRRPVDGGPADHFCWGTLDYIPATAIKGMLSTYYEAITNSRYRVFSKHDKKPAYRSQANPDLVPGRIMLNAAGTFEVELFPGTSALGTPNPLYAAWLPTYRGGPLHRLTTAGTPVTATISRYQYNRGFELWSVDSIGTQRFTPVSEHITPVPGTDRTVTGYVVVSGKIFNRKHDERFFFNATGTPQVFPIPRTVQEDYEELVADYQDVHQPGGPFSNPGDNTVFGEHITTPARKRMRNGDFVYVDMSGAAVKAVFPVQISRKLSEKTPRSCVYPSILPAESLEKLSPADRLFGWVAQGQGGAWKGKIRISDGIFSRPVKEPNQTPTEILSPPRALAILNGAKPAQARFYLGDIYGNPQNARLSKDDASYRGNKKLRGRKFYLHQIAQNAAYWNTAESAFVRDRSRQNRSISSWIPPGRRFKFNIRVENLTRTELGALLTLLAFPDQRCFKLGYAKPLGFGSVWLRLDLPQQNNVLPVLTGQQRKDRYRAFGAAPVSTLDEAAREGVILDYKAAMVEAYAGHRPGIPESWKNATECQGDWVDMIRGEKKAAEALGALWRTSIQNGLRILPVDDIGEYAELLEEPERTALQKAYDLDRNAYSADVQAQWSGLSFIGACITALEGRPAAQVHYPRSAPGDKGFTWFVKNETSVNSRVVNGHCLPVMGGTLPELEE